MMAMQVIHACVWESAELHKATFRLQCGHCCTFDTSSEEAAESMEEIVNERGIFRCRKCEALEKHA